jgi:hypothetical protein
MEVLRPVPTDLKIVSGDSQVWEKKTRVHVMDVPDS